MQTLADDTPASLTLVAFLHLAHRELARFENAWRQGESEDPTYPASLPVEEWWEQLEAFLQAGDGVKYCEKVQCVVYES